MSNETRVLFNADCPICNAEICHYRSYTEARGLDVTYDDLNTDALAPWQLDADTAAQRLHVLKNGRVYVGVEAFAELWSDMPRYRWMSRAVRLPGVWQVANILYNHLLAPRLYRKHLKRQSAEGQPTPPR
jgi:predicted DCC family thiol-disulfide oxidoreductase YuxK